SLAGVWGPVRLGNEVHRVRVIFNYGFKNGLIGKPVLFGDGFRRPSKKTLRKEKAKKGLRMFEAAEIRRILAVAGQPLKTMVLLGVNCGYGNADVGNLPQSALDQGGWVQFPRPKTGISRRCPLWAETIQALREWMVIRPAAAKPEHASLVFLTYRGRSWAKQGYFDADGKPRNLSE